MMRCVSRCCSFRSRHHCGRGAEIVRVVFGFAFVQAGPLLALLIVGAILNVMLMVSITIMTAAGFQPNSDVYGPVVLWRWGDIWLIPRSGEQGAALVTVVVSSLGAPAVGVSVYALWKVWPPVATLMRSLAIGLVVGVASLWWSTPGLFVFAKLVLLGMFSLLGYWWIGEFRHGEIAVVRSLLVRKTEPVEVGGGGRGSLGRGRGG